MFSLNLSLNLSDKYINKKLRVTGNHVCFILVNLNCISLNTYLCEVLPTKLPNC